MFPDVIEISSVDYKLGHWPPTTPETYKKDDSYVVEASKAHPNYWPPRVVIRKKDA